MISLIDIYGAIKKQLLKTGIKNIYDAEVTQGFKRPCFFINLIVDKDDNETIHLNEKNILVSINYFSKNKTQLENLEMYEILKKSFSLPLQIDDRKILPSKISTESKAYESNRFLQFSFWLKYYDNTYFDEGKEEYPVMQDLDIKINNKRGYR
ncbi:phage tail terminator family protein [Clostridium botulinum]|uniref:phage tail terminator family protein n=1 Tax=Clostridium botulinum TaxID=1491 RepID=UPI001E647B71|nr:hypothetical protein [Clostridium botulinum]MCD3223940.1 hypothetical protein [Clostridium botulinum C/D]MCD3296289.1 hypothetical protein [Clostridium botulinum C/D]